MKFQAILKKYRDQSYSEKDKGTRFEKLMGAFLKTAPIYAGKIKTVWLWHEFFFRNDRSVIERVIERYPVKTDNDSGLKKDLNDEYKEHEKPQYIMDLL